MTIKASDRISTSQLPLFDSILRATGGRYIDKPTISGQNVYLYYEFGDYTAHTEAWNRATTQIREIKPTVIKRLFRKIKGLFL